MLVCSLWVVILFISCFFPSHEAVALWDDLLTRGRVLLAMYKRKHEALAEKRERLGTIILMHLNICTMTVGPLYR